MRNATKNNQLSVKFRRSIVSIRGD